ncbi:MAG: DUF3488 and transglutaminase-like domain-containing protein, partial [Candidatus Eremiobacterota bacterium]
MRILRNWIEFLKRQVHPPENSLPYRAVTAVCVMLGVVASCHMLEWPDYGFLTMVLTPCGFLLSYRLRSSNTWHVKAVLSVGMVLSLLQFFLHLGQSTYDPRIPLAELLLWLQTLHSFDVPARRDLNYSLLVSLILISLAAVLSSGMSYVLYLLIYLPFSLLALHYNYLSRLSEQAGVRVAELGTFRAAPRMAGRSLKSALPLLLVAAVLFSLLPRYEGLRLRALPVSWDIQFRLPRSSTGDIVNPATSGDASSGGRPSFNPDGYFGFNPEVDLNLRGQMSEEVVLHVRTSDWTYYRGLAFDEYTGRSWRLSEGPVDILKAENPPFFLQLRDRGDRTVVQIVTVQRQLPNLVFAAHQPYQIFFPSQELFVDQELSLRSPFTLEEGMVYSVVSLVPQVTPAQLKKVRSLERHPKRLSRYLQRPPLSARLKQLTHHLTDRYGSDYEKAAALTLHLQQNYAYSLDIPPFPEGTEMSDYFLFEQKAGYCEQFATALTVMCREAGIPARYVNGYLPGTYNPFTGSYEVKNNEAHAWTEIYIRTVGWVSFDPSPGFVPNPGVERPRRSRWLFGTLLEYVRGKLGDER